MDTALYDRLVLTFRRLIDVDEIVGRTIPRRDLASRMYHAIFASSKEEAVGSWRGELVDIFWWSEDARFQICVPRHFFARLAQEEGISLEHIDAIYILASRNEKAKVIVDDGVKEHEKVVREGTRVEFLISQFLAEIV